MHLVFDPSFDSGAWPGPLAGRDAALGEAWCGPHGLVTILERALGLVGPHVPRMARAASILPAVRETEGFWTASARVDPLGTAERLLAWRDALYLAGWRGEALAGRLGALADVTTAAPPGLPDRLLAIAEALPCRSANVDRIELLEPTSDRPAVWNLVLDRLSRGGTKIEVRALSAAQAKGDLAAARSRRFTPDADGSLRLVRPHGPLRAAEEVAAWLASQDDLEGTVIVAPDAILDRALRRFGLPTLGGRAADEDSSLLQILPLVLELGWSPPDPERALELLTLPASPVPPAVACRLVGALTKWPAVDSDEWRKKLREGLDAIEEPERRRTIEERLAILFASPVDRAGGYPASEIRKRIGLVERWFRGRWDEDSPEAPWWAAAANQCVALRTLLDSWGADQWTEPQLARFVDLATGSDLGIAIHPAEAGLAAVVSPGAIAGPARRIVWWGFRAEAARPPERIPLHRSELEALARAGCPLVDPGVRALADAERWRRPLLQATETLLLVAPRRGEEGEELYPHPLWDEILAGLEDAREGSRLSCPRPADGLPRTARAPRPLPRPVRDWRAPSTRVRLPEKISATALTDFLGCSFRWAIKYVGDVWSSPAASLPSGPLLLGSLTHQIVELVLAEGPASPDAAAGRAGALFDELVPRLAASLYRPGLVRERQSVRRITIESCRVLVRILQSSGLDGIAIERELESKGFGLTFKGRPDLVVSPPPIIVDLKWGDARGRREMLKRGTAYQLAIYSHLVRSDRGGDMPPIAYFILSEQRLLATAACRLEAAETIDGPSVEETWAGIGRAYHRARDEIGSGQLLAPANPAPDGTAEPEESDLDPERGLVLAPPCKYCEFDGLCGKKFDGAGG